MSNVLKKTKATMYPKIAEAIQARYMAKVKFSRCPEPRMNMMKFKSKG